MTRPALYRPPDDPVLFLDAESENYARDYTFARLVHAGAVPRVAAEWVGITADNAFQLLSRWRRQAKQWAGQPVSDTAVLRLICDRERAELEWKKIAVSLMTKNGA